MWPLVPAFRHAHLALAPALGPPQQPGRGEYAGGHQQHHQRGQLAEAENIYRQIIQHEPNHAAAWHLWGVAAHQAGRHAEAIQHIERALAIGGPNPIFLNHLGAAFAALKRLDEAENAFRRAAEIAPSDPQVHYNLAALLVLRERKEEAIAIYRHTVSLAPKFAEAQLNLGNLLRDAQPQMQQLPIFAIAPGMMIFLTVMSINFIGDGLRDALDPYGRR